MRPLQDKASVANGSELETLVRYLNKMRNPVVAALEGLDEEAARRPGVPSGTSLLGIVHHLTGVEDHWFQVVFLGRDLRVDKSMSPPAAATTDQVIAWYQAACDRSDAAVHGCGDASRLAARPNPGEDAADSLRMIVAHMIEETGRHAGHADILRELIDGRTASV